MTRRLVGVMREGPGRPAAVALGVFALGVELAIAASAPAVARTTGSERFDGGLVASGVSGKRAVIGSVVAASGVFNGVGRILERDNRPGDSGRVSRDDLVFPEGTIHIKNVSKKVSVSPDLKTCTITFRVTQVTTVEGGTRRFAGAKGTFDGVVSGSGVARRTAGGSCDQKHVALAEVDMLTGTGELSF